MNRSTQDHQHAGHGHDSAKRKSGVHRDWRFWTVIVMLVAMGIYVLTIDESFGPEGENVPAAVDDVAAP